MSLTISPSPFGSLVVSVAETGSTLSVTTVATSPSVLTMALGVPGPAGATGSQGPAGTNGTNGVGVPVGGTTGQVLSKINSTNYNTQWTTPSGGTWGSITGTLSSQTDLQSALDGKLSLTGGTMASGALVDFAVDTNGNTSELGAWGLGLHNANTNSTATVEPAQIRTYNGDYVNGTSLTPNGINFNDETTQTTAYDPAVLGNYLPLTGGNLNLVDPSTFSAYIRDIDENLSAYVKIGYGDGDGGTGGYIALNNIDGGKIGFYTNTDTGYNGGGWIKFVDNTIQSTAFPPDGGTTSQYITGTGSLVTFPPVGDRYLTSSTTTLTVDSGNGKTMTVGTGLSYSPQQDITVSYNTANHMHGTVLTYNSTTGVMTWDSNTHSGSGTYSNWEVNVGGVAGAVLPVGGTASQVLAKINSSNFNTEWKTLGTMSSEPASAYLSTASAVANYLTISSASSTYQTQAGMSAYLSTLAAASTYQTQSGMSAYLSTSAAASTYQTQSGMSAYLSTASASANFIGTSAYATTAQAQAGTSTTTVINPSTLLDAKYFAGGKFITGITWATATSGAGASAAANGVNARVAQAPTSATGYGQNIANIYNSSRGGAYTAGIDWSKRVIFGGRFARNVTTPDTNSVFRYSLGRFSSQAPSDITASDKMVGIKVSGSGAIVLYVANGSALTTTTSSFTPSNSSAYDVVIVSDGSGNVTLYVNGSSVATSTGGPTSSQGTNYFCLSFETQNTATLSNGGMVILGSDFFAQVNS